MTKAVGAPGTVAPRRGIQAMDTGLRLLEVLAAAPGALPLRDLAAAAGLSTSLAHRHLASHTAAGLVQQDPATGRYDLGPLALRLGLAALGRLDPVNVAAGAIRRAVSGTVATGLVFVWSERGPVLVRWERSAAIAATSLALGTVFPLLSSTVGRAFLAHLPERMTAPLLAREMGTTLPDGGVADARAVTRIVGAVRETGLSTLSGHVVPGYRAAAAPVLDAGGEAAVVLSLVSAEASDDLSAMLRSAALEASESLGHRVLD